MNCKIVLTQIDDYIDAALEPVQHQQVQSHLGICDSCHQSWQQELEFRQLLKEHPVPAAKAGLEERVFAKLPRKTRASKNAFMAGFSGAIAAGIVLFIVATVVFQPDVQQPVANIVLTLHESKKVNMLFDVPERVAEATVSMQVPEHIEIAGRKGLHQIEWKTALKKGKNLLSLPIVAKMMASGELVAKIKYGKQEKVFRLKLDIHQIEQGLVETVSVGMV
ncbi:MAG: zf-HC2 domain-containing protein [Gammaproteobacteria bacterium]|nr:zf-HC2 domain-containing protein [Gammaproteobacteria bacterium]